MELAKELAVADSPWTRKVNLSRLRLVSPKGPNFIFFSSSAVLLYETPLVGALERYNRVRETEGIWTGGAGTGNR